MDVADRVNHIRPTHRRPINSNRPSWRRGEPARLKASPAIVPINAKNGWPWAGNISGYGPAIILTQLFGRFFFPNRCRHPKPVLKSAAACHPVRPPSNAAVEPAGVTIPRGHPRRIIGKCCGRNKPVRFNRRPAHQFSLGFSIAIRRPIVRNRRNDHVSSRFGPGENPAP